MIKLGLISITIFIALVMTAQAQDEIRNQAAKGGIWMTHPDKGSPEGKRITNGATLGNFNLYLGRQTTSDRNRDFERVLNGGNSTKITTGVVGPVLNPITFQWR